MTDGRTTGDCSDCLRVNRLVEPCAAAGCPSQLCGSCIEAGAGLCERCASDRPLRQFGGDPCEMKRPTFMDAHDGCRGEACRPLEVRSDDERVAGLCPVCRRWAGIVIH